MLFAPDRVTHRPLRLWREGGRRRTFSTNDVALQINGVTISADLNDRATRRMIEHAVIVATGGTDVELANR